MMMNETVDVDIVCPCCGRVNTLTLNLNDFMDWKFEGKLVQDAFPYLDADERELLISGTCKRCWDEMFAEEQSLEEEDWLILDEDEEEDEDWEDDVDETNYDPYLGCEFYDFSDYFSF